MDTDERVTNGEGPVTHTEEPVIDVTDLRRCYGGGPGSVRRGARRFEAVRGVTFSVARGELFALLGTNGAGKTSTVELLEGLARPDGGRVRVLGHDPYAQRASVRPRIGVMLQEGGFPSELTVAETVRMWAGCTSSPRPMDEALDAVGLSRRADIRVKQLSGGERRRLDLALALLGRPEVLFLDEPTTGLDAEGRRDTWQLVRALRDAGTTVLLTTHYLEEAEELADRIAILHEGRIATHGRLTDVVAQQPSQISFELPEGYTLGDLPPLASLGVTEADGPGAPSGPEAASWGTDRTPGPLGRSGSRSATRGRRIRLRTNELQRAATRLLVWAEQTGVELSGLDIRSASLEEVFLGIAREAGRGSTVPAPGEDEDTGSGPSTAGGFPGADGSPQAADPPRTEDGAPPGAGPGAHGGTGSSDQGTGGTGPVAEQGRKRKGSAV